jgi:hypothetical protein
MTAINQPSKQPAERRIMDEAGTTWRVTEMRTWDTNGRSANSLIAAHERGFRRLWDFPANWLELGDVQLAELVSKPARKGKHPEPAEAAVETPVAPVLVVPVGPGAAAAPTE